jgi:ubiquinone/menaquinone biosynthesis C-methylase UbiE
MTHHREHTHGTPAVGHTLHSARLYDAFVGVYTLGRERRLRNRTLDAVVLAPGERVLDICCGTGTLTLAARTRVGASGSVDGVDASPEMIARATAKAADGDVRFQIAQAQSLPFPDGSFDVVLCSLGFHHLPEEARDAALAEMRRVLAPGGRVLLVEFTRSRGVWALNPLAWVHLARSTSMARGVRRRDGRRARVRRARLRPGRARELRRAVADRIVGGGNLHMQVTFR